MPSFTTRSGRPVSFKAKQNPKRKKTRSKTTKTKRLRKAAKKAARANPRRPAAKKVLSKKVGKWRVECRGRTVYAAGAKHSYQNSAAACAAYKRITSVKSVKSFVSRYGKQSTKAVVLGTSKRAAPKSKVAKKRAPKKAAKRRAKRRNPRRNVPISARDAAAIRRILRTHGV